MTTSALVRQWWYEYGQALRDEQNSLGRCTALWALTDTLQAQGVIRPGRPMVRTGAEDLARDCDELLRARQRFWAPIEKGM